MYVYIYIYIYMYISILKHYTLTQHCILCLLACGGERVLLGHVEVVEVRCLAATCACGDEHVVLLVTSHETHIHTWEAI